MSHLNNARAILAGRKQIIRVSTKIRHITQCVSVRQGRQIFVGYVMKNITKEIIRIHKSQQKLLYYYTSIKGDMELFGRHFASTAYVISLHLVSLTSHFK